MYFLFPFEHLLEMSGGETLGPLDWRSQRSVPDELGDNAHGTGDTKEDGVEVLLGQTVVL